MKKNLLSAAVKGALGLTAAAIMVPAMPAFAQEDAQLVEEIVVTGSRIKRTDLQSVGPVSVVTADDMKVKGIVNVAEALQQLTAQSGGLTSAVNNGSAGKATVNLRGLGAQRTLVLVNGRRMVAGGTGADASVDLNTIPVSIIERIEVFKDGASAIYGSDAIAGVVNIITKKDFEGVTINAQTGQSFESDGKEQQFDITWGVTSDRGNMVANIGIYDRNGVLQGDRAFSECPLDETETGEPVIFCAGSSNIESTRLITDDFDIAFEDWQSGGYHAFNDGDRYNFAATSYNSTPVTRYNLNLNGNYQITDTLNFFGEGSYTKRLSEQQMAPQPINYQLGWYIPTDPDTYPYAGKYEGQPGWGVTDGIEDGKLALPLRRMTELGNRVFEQSVDSVRLVAGFNGDLGNYSWDTAVNYGRTDAIARSHNYLNMGRVYKSVDQNCEGVTYNPATGMVEGNNPEEPCINYFGAGSLTEADAEYLRYTDQATGYNQQLSAEFNISGDLMSLPAGVLGFAFGAVHREVEGGFQPDALTVAGLGSGNATSPTQGGYKVDEAYIEFGVPVFSGTVVGDLDLSIASRVFNYDTFGSGDTWKFGATWHINDMLMLRSSVATAYRAPSINELYGGQSTSYLGYTDPCNGFDNTAANNGVDAKYSDACAADFAAGLIENGHSQSNDQVRAVVGGNPELTPETADTFTAGIVVQPLDGLDFTIDYFKTEVDNVITSIEPDLRYSECYAAGAAGGVGGTSTWCEGVARDATGNFNLTPGFDINAAFLSVKGVDLSTRYAFEAAGLSWTVDYEASHIMNWEEIPHEGGTPVEYQGVALKAGGSTPEWKHNLSLSVTGDRWTAYYGIKHIAELEDQYTAWGGNPEKLADGTAEAITYHRITGSYQLTDSVTLAGGVMNLTDETPPYYSSYQDANTDQYLYDTVGRRYYLSASMNF